MLNNNIIKLILILFIAIKTSISNKSEETPRNIFSFSDIPNKYKDIHFNQDDVNKFVNTKSTGLQLAVLDLDFPEEQMDSETYTLKKQPKYRVVQCLMTGHVDYLQRKVYKKVAVKLTGRDPYDTDTEKACSNEVLLTLSPPAKIGTDNLLTNHYKLYETKVVINKNESKVVEFEDVFNKGFVDMKLFWINFEISGKCSKYIAVELLKPNNSNEWGDLDPPSETEGESSTAPASAPGS